MKEDEAVCLLLFKGQHLYVSVSQPDNSLESVSNGPL